MQQTDEIDLRYRFNPAHWGKGYATEAALHTLLYDLDELNLKEIFGKTHIDNIASQVLKKIGMRYLKKITEDDTKVKLYVATKVSA